MLFLDEHKVPIYLESIDVPTISEYFWALSLIHMDFMLNKIVTFEEMHTESLIFSVKDYVIELPTSWNVLIYSEETSQLDIVEASDFTKHKFTPVIYNHKTDKIDTMSNDVTVIDYKMFSKLRTPSLQKGTMLCHPIGHEHWICISPTDNFNKYLKNSVIGDLIF